MAAVAPVDGNPDPRSVETMNRLITYLTGSTREARLAAALRRIVEAQALAAWANTSADHEPYERLANDRDDAIEAAVALVEGDQ